MRFLSNLDLKIKVLLVIFLIFGLIVLSVFFESLFDDSSKLSPIKISQEEVALEVVEENGIIFGETPFSEVPLSEKPGEIFENVSTTSGISKIVNSLDGGALRTYVIDENEKVILQYSPVLAKSPAEYKTFTEEITSRGLSINGFDKIYKKTYDNNEIRIYVTRGIAFEILGDSDLVVGLIHFAPERSLQDFLVKYQELYVKNFIPEHY